jgi:hypothetical protein
LSLWKGRVVTSVGQKLQKIQERQKFQKLKNFKNGQNKVRTKSEQGQNKVRGQKVITLLATFEFLLSIFFKKTSVGA